MSVAVGTAQPSRLASPIPAMSEVDGGGRDHAADRSGGGDQRIGRLAQAAQDQLALELEAGQEEEHGEAAIGGPVLETQRPEVEVQDRLVAVEVDVGPDQRDDRRCQEEEAADGLLPERVRDEAALVLRLGCPDPLHRGDGWTRRRRHRIRGWSW